MQTFSNAAFFLLLFWSVVTAESFDWGKYICSNNVVGAPVSCFKHVSRSWMTWGSDFVFWMLKLFLPQAPMGTSWGDIEEGVRIEVPNSDISLPTKVYWIAEIVKLAGRTSTKKRHFLF